MVMTHTLHLWRQKLHVSLGLGHTKKEKSKERFVRRGVVIRKRASTRNEAYVPDESGVTHAGCHRRACCDAWQGCSRPCPADERGTAHGGLPQDSSDEREQQASTDDEHEAGSPPESTNQGRPPRSSRRERL